MFKIARFIFFVFVLVLKERKNGQIIRILVCNSFNNCQVITFGGVVRDARLYLAGVGGGLGLAAIPV